MKKIIILIIFLTVITGCSNNTLKENKEPGGNGKTISDNTNVDKKDESSNIDEEEVEEYISNIENDVILLDDNLDSNDKNKLKEYFITLTDFIFYDGKIKGITFKELSIEAKEKVLIIYEAIDNKIESIWPDYKETIKTNSTRAYNSIKDKFNELKEEVKNKYIEEVGEEAYNNQVEVFLEDKDRLIQSIKPRIDYVEGKSKALYEEVKDKMNDWYLNFKEAS